ncbi:hypothetical protein Q4Q35_11410 [Flavivirga aquimarina]|uniref:Secretion system C-terminal sorting domain-containing protein n=1 Tax=Flavivirga aquimarina TaxID=2027862 RepID=A0ABT8WB88_9FLAO|nr:hypothetical protein [Flavivirga aquimarina]MDO5970412.1 hypothetical protein [Flavivirga aquimarina]
MKTHIFLFTLSNFNANTTSNRDDITETTDDIVVTLSGGSGLDLFPVSPIGGDGCPNIISVGFNIDVISFVVKASEIEFDYLSVNSFQTKPDADDPDSVSYMLNVKDVSGFKLMEIYDEFGQMVLQGKNKRGAVSRLAKGMYFFKDLQFSRKQK